LPGGGKRCIIYTGRAGEVEYDGSEGVKAH